MQPVEPDAKLRAEGAAIFAQPDVVASYYARQPYAPDAYAALLRLVPARRRALDLGCGPGPVARRLAEAFDEVVALDPSEGMIAAGRAADRGAHPNIRWVCARAEEFDDEAGFDIVVAGSSVHFVDPAAAFPKLARWTHLMATLANDPLFPHPPPPCGIDRWVDFLGRWNARVGRTTPAGWLGPPDRVKAPAMPHESWVDVAGRKRFRFGFRQSVPDFIASCHARVSWPRRTMGERLAAEFDADLAELLDPFAQSGALTLDVITDLVWGAPRTAPRGGAPPTRPSFPPNVRPE